MTRNPYEHPMDIPPDLGGVTRVSGLAVSSLVFGLLCCIPGSGLIAVILGGAGLLAIGNSEGRLTGRGMAFIGLILGLLGSVGWIAVGVGGRQMLAVYERQVFEPTVAMIQQLEQQDFKEAAKVVSAATGATEAEFKDFADKVRDQLGPVVPGQKFSLRKYFTAQTDVNIQSQGAAQPLPIVVEFKNGAAIVVLVIDSSNTVGEIITRQTNLEGKVTNIAVFHGSQQFWLIDPARKKSK